MKVLLSAYACEPGLGSEPGVGWSMATAIAKYQEVWVLTRIAHRPGIEAEIARNPIPNLKFIYFDPFNWTNDWRSKQTGVQFHYYLWQIQAYFEVVKLKQKINFDLVHHVTYVKYWGPSFLSLLPVPFLWGPVGGGEDAPKSFWQDFSPRGKVYEVLRDLAHWVGEKDPFVQLTARRCALALATTKDTAEKLYLLGVSKVNISSESGLTIEEIESLGNFPLPSLTPIRFISMGRLLHWKGFHLGLRAFAKAKLENAEYWILGDGPEEQRLDELAQELEIAHQVKFWGRLPRQESLSKLKDCHVLVHPSLHDSGGWVCLEGMAAGRPILCLDLGGPATQVTEETGFKITAGNPEKAVEDLAKAMIRLANEPELLINLGKGGQKRVKEVYDWQEKGKFLDQLYQEIVALRSDKTTIE